MNYHFLPNNIPNLMTKYPKHNWNPNQELKAPTSTKLVNLGSRLTTSRCTWIHHNQGPRNSNRESAPPKSKTEPESGIKIKSFFSTSSPAGSPRTQPCASRSPRERHSTWPAVFSPAGSAAG